MLHASAVRSAGTTAQINHGQCSMLSVAESVANSRNDHQIPSTEQAIVRCVIGSRVDQFDLIDFFALAVLALCLGKATRKKRAYESYQKWYFNVCMRQAQGRCSKAMEFQNFKSTTSPRLMPKITEAEVFSVVETNRYIGQSNWLHMDVGILIK